MRKIILIITPLIITLAIGFGGGFIFGKANVSENGISGIQEELKGLERILSKEPTFDLLNEGIAVIKTKYVDSGDITEKELIYGAMDGILKALGDPYSVFFPPPDAKIFKEDVGGAFEGIGAEIGIRDKVLTVISPLKDSPAEKAGLKSGDIILYVDDTETQDLSLDEAVKIIRGPKDTQVVLTVSRKGEEEDLKISIIRDKIKIPNLKWELKGEDKDIAYIALYHFSETASDDFGDIVREVLNSSAKKIILDLRNNPGGFLEVSVDIAGWFLEPDLVVVTEDHKGKAENKIYTTRGSAVLLEYPLVVLINEGSASASEILAGALRDHRNIKLVGETTFGKGSVQELTNLSDKSSIKITVAKWLTPNGLSIEDNGLEPDVTIEMTQKIYEDQGDVQIEKAIEVVSAL
jgi:carboxyl-terminal processing protease